VQNSKGMCIFLTYCFFFCPLLTSFPIFPEQRVLECFHLTHTMTRVLKMGAKAIVKVKQRLFF
jgi:hypothetical protein